MSDPLASAIDDVVNFVREHRGIQPHEVLPALLMIEGRVAALCGARGIPPPYVTYLGTYAEHTEFCRIPITRSTLGVRIWWDEGWSAAMQGLRAGIAERTPQQPEAEQTEGSGTPRDQAGAGKGEGGSLSPSRRKALSQYRDAVSKRPDLGEATDRDVYDWIVEHSDGDPLPEFATWSRYLRGAREATGTSKTTLRSGRTGRSIVRPDEI